MQNKGTVYPIFDQSIGSLKGQNVVDMLRSPAHLRETMKSSNPDGVFKAIQRLPTRPGLVEEFGATTRPVIIDMIAGPSDPISTMTMLILVIFARMPSLSLYTLGLQCSGTRGKKY